ncbi:MAG: guanylate kinase [Muribaculaceae bacterium]|nr:guanylate kinase [Muribaculaceae bacterium]MDE6118343.1 guanylate kinase [Muribaculaceae bacterium]MDE6314966.1 guanylate kinase [Muribaculaceae bacterium]
MAGKVIIISAPSGCGKSTIISALMNSGEINMQFSVSATNRAPRGQEINGKDYHFLSDEEFRSAIATDAFLEYEEVYPGRFYGTLKSEIDRIASNGSNVVLDIDVNGGLRVKHELAEKALSIFIKPPSIGALRSRLEKRGTDSMESIDARVDRAQYEIEQAPRYDVTVVNDDLDTAVAEVKRVIVDFLNND